MSSYYTTAQLEAMRKAKLKAELLENLGKIRAQLLEEHQNEVAVTAAANIKITVMNDDEGVSGFHSSVRIGEGVRREQVSSSGSSSRNILDLSSLLRERHDVPSQMALEIEKLVKSIEQRAVITEQDAAAKERILHEVSKTMDDNAMDIEDKLRYLRMRINSYIQGGTPISAVDYEKLESEYYDYCALCQLVGETPTETLPANVSSATKRLLIVAEEQRQDAYITDTIGEIMHSLGCSVKEQVVLDHTEGQLFSVDGHPLCDVFVGADGSGIMFEPVARTAGGSLDQKRTLEYSANKVCSMYDKIEELALEKGIVLKRVYAEPASVESMCSQSDLQASKKDKQHKKTKTAKPKARAMEDQ